MKFCKKCGCETERRSNGRCKPCEVERGSKYYAANKEKARAATERWQTENPDKVREYYAENRDKALAYRAAYRAANPEKIRILRQIRRAKKRLVGGRLSTGLAGRLLMLQKGKCACCGLPLGDDYHLDHIMPLALGGPNTDDNIQLLRAKCNKQKHAKHPVDFMREKGFLL